MFFGGGPRRYLTVVLFEDIANPAAGSLAPRPRTQLVPLTTGGRGDRRDHGIAWQVGSW